MSKKLNLVYEWIGPQGPITNNRLPTIADLMTAQVNYHFPNTRGDLFQKPHFHSRIKNSNIVPAYKLPDGKFVYELNFGLYHYRDRLHNFSNNDGLLDNNSITNAVIDRVKAKQAFFLITLFYEGYMDDDILEAMGDYFTHKQIPLSQVIYLTNCGNGKEVYADFCRRKNKVPEMQMEYFPVFRIDKCDVKSALAGSLTMKYTPGPRKKTFLCFNRRYNDHRLLFFMSVVKKGLLDQFYMSMAKTQPEASRSFRENVKYLLSRFDDMGLGADDITESESVLPLILDTADFSNYPMEHSPDPVKGFYDTSLVNIVTETYFFNRIIHVTEKTYKPMAFMQPFIVLGAVGSLKHVKDMGFKTFDSFWDESYDAETDDKKRFNMILKIVEDIASWPEQKKIDFTYQVAEIVEFNLNHLNTLQDVEIDHFVEKYGE